MGSNPLESQVAWLLLLVPGVFLLSLYDRLSCSPCSHFLTVVLSFACNAARYRCPHAPPSMLFRSAVQMGTFHQDPLGEGGYSGTSRFAQGSNTVAVKRTSHNLASRDGLFPRTLLVVMDDQFHRGDLFCHYYSPRIFHLWVLHPLNITPKPRQGGPPEPPSC